LQDEGARVALGKAQVVSAPSAMVSSTRIASDRARTILRGVAQTGSRLVVELDFFAETTGKTSAQAIAFDQGPRALLMYVRRDYAFIEEWNDTGGVLAQSQPTAFAPNAWHHVRLELADRTALLSVDGAQVANLSLSNGWTGELVDVSVGIGYGNGDDGPWSFVYDNVLIGVR
jgi:hypothetical protein